MLTSLPEIKQRLYAMRNGMLADSLRHSGSPFKVIFGLNLPQIIEISNDIPKSIEIAEELRRNSTSRECQLLAPMIYPSEKLTLPEAEKWVTENESPEVADILCMKLLRRTLFAIELVDTLMASQRPMNRYTGLRLVLNFLSHETEKAKAYASAEFKLDHPQTKAIAYSVLDEINLLEEEKQ